MKELFPAAADLGNYLLGTRMEERISKRMEVEGSQILKSPLTIITRKTWVWKSGVLISISEDEEKPLNSLMGE